MTWLVGEVVVKRARVPKPSPFFPIVVGFFVGFGGGTVNGLLEVVVLGLPDLLTLVVLSGGLNWGVGLLFAGGASVVAALMPSDLLRRCLNASGVCLKRSSR